MVSMADPHSIRPPMRMSARSPPRWIRARRTPLLVKRSRCEQGSQLLTETLGVPDPKPAPDECVQVNSTGDDIASCVRITESAVLRQHQLVEGLRLNEREVVAGAGATGRGERPSLRRVPVSG